MSRKRQLKKQEKRSSDAAARFEALLRRGADDEALALAAREWRDPGAAAVAAPWAETADRALHHCLARADFGRLHRLVPVVRSAAAPRPLAALAGAVLDLQAGRLAEARSGLDALAAGPAGGELPTGLLTELSELAREPRLDEAPEAAPEPTLKPAAELWRALRDLAAAGGELTTRNLAALDRRLAAASEGPTAGDPAATALLDRCRGHLALAAELEGLAGALGRPGRPAAAPPAERLRAWLDGERGARERLAAALAGPGPDLAEPLRHLVLRRWRAVLEAVAATPGGQGLAAIVALDPRPVAGELRRADGSPAALWAEHARARSLAGQGQWEELRALLRRRARGNREPGELAALWGAELGAWRKQAVDALPPDDEDDWDDQDHDPGPDAHAVVVRLGEMAAEVGRRFPPEHRLEVAQALRDELFFVLEEVHFCAHVAATARALLEHADGDPGLLFAGVAGAVAAGDPAALRHFQDRLARQPPLRPADHAVAVRVLGPVAFEPPPQVARVLELVRPLLGDDAWPAVRDRVARELVRMIGGGIDLAVDEALFEDATTADEEILSQIRDDLDLLRPLLADAPGFAGAELAVDCLERPVQEAERRLEAYLEARPGWQAALLPMRLLEAPAQHMSIPAVDAAFGLLGNAAVDRLDDRWRLWLSDLRLLVISADPQRQRKLSATLKRLARAPGLPPEEREELKAAVEILGRAQAMLKAFSRGKPPSRRAGKRGEGGEGGEGRRKRRSRRSGDPQLDLKFPE
jgi:hypothetical protein